MSSPTAATSSSVGQRFIDGVSKVLAAELLAPVTGIITAAFLTRRLGPDGYGLLTITVSVIVWFQSSLIAVTSGTTVKFVRLAEDWRPVATRLLQIQLALGFVAAMTLVAFAGSIAVALGEPRLAFQLRLFAVDIPLFNLVVVHRQILVGRAQFRGRAAGAAVRWIMRLVLIVLLVELFRDQGYAVEAALTGMIGASVAELVLLRRLIQPPIWKVTAVSMAILTGYMLPLFANRVGYILIERLDLLLFKGLGGTTAEAGVLSAAKNLALVPGILALAFVPLLLSSLTEMAKQSQSEAAELAQNALRATVLCLPFAAVAAGSSEEIVRLIFGGQFAGAGSLFSILIFGSVTSLTMATSVAIIVAAGRPMWCLGINPPLALIAIVSHLAVIPRWGTTGAVSVTTAVIVLGTLECLALVNRLWGVRLPAWLIFKSAAISAVIFMLARLVPSSGALVVLKVAFLSGLAVGFLMLVGAVTRAEMAHLLAATGLTPKRVSPG